MVNNTINTCDEDPPGCANPPNPNKTTACLDCVASTLVLGKEAVYNVAPVQEPTISLNTTSPVPIQHTMKSSLLKPKKLPITAKRAFLVKDIPHNLVAVSELVDAGYIIHLFFWGFDIDCESETMYKG